MVTGRSPMGASKVPRARKPTLEVQYPSRTPEIRTGHLWVYRGERGDVVYDFTWTRNRDGRPAILCSLVQTCKHLQINSFVYLRDRLRLRVRDERNSVVLRASANQARQRTHERSGRVALECPRSGGTAGEKIPRDAPSSSHLGSPESIRRRSRWLVGWHPRPYPADGGIGCDPSASGGALRSMDPHADRNYRTAGYDYMAKRNTSLAKKSLVVEADDLRKLVAVGGYRNESEAVRAAVASTLAIRQMQDAIRTLQTGGTFGRRLR
jgi:hypothetical protein